MVEQLPITYLDADTNLDDDLKTRATMIKYPLATKIMALRYRSQDKKETKFVVSVAPSLYSTARVFLDQVLKHHKENAKGGAWDHICEIWINGDVDSLF